MSEEPTNRELAIMLNELTKRLDLRFDQNDKDHKGTNDHLKELNGQVIKNTKFRWQAIVYGGLIIIVTPIIINKVLDKLF